MGLHTTHKRDMIIGEVEYPPNGGYSTCCNSPIIEGMQLSLFVVTCYGFTEKMRR